MFGGAWLMNVLTSRDWWTAAGYRAVRTMAQALIALLGAAVVLTDVDWVYCLSATGLAGVLSVLTSLAGLPELDSTNTAYIEE